MARHSWKQAWGALRWGGGRSRSICTAPVAQGLIWVLKECKLMVQHSLKQACTVEKSGAVGAPQLPPPPALKIQKSYDGFGKEKYKNNI